MRCHLLSPVLLLVLAQPAWDGALLGGGIANKDLSKAHTWGVPVKPGVDEISLAFTTDAWSRTRRSVALTVAEDLDEIETANGLVLLPDLVAGAR